MHLASTKQQEKSDDDSEAYPVCNAVQVNETDGKKHLHHSNWVRNQSHGAGGEFCGYRQVPTTRTSAYSKLPTFPRG